jgi:pimeloyl-ACP methyl ester carboxylesterase
VTAPAQGSLAFDRFGEGEPLVLIHGLSSRRGAWAPAAQRAAAEREVIAVDLPGFGDSPWDGTTATVDQFTAAMQGFFDDLGLERPHVAGNSLGGGIAFELARRDAARSLTVFSPIGLASRAERRWLYGAFRTGEALGRRVPDDLPPQAQLRVARPLLFVFSFGNPWRVPDEEIVATAENGADPPAYDATLRVINDYWLERPEELRTVPTTVAWGSRDVLIPAWSNRRRARQALPWAHHLSLPGCGHVPFFDDPEACARVLLEGSTARG